MDPIATSLERALTRIEEFNAIHEPAVSREAIGCLEEAVGISDDELSLLIDHFDREPYRKHTAPILLGLIIGLLTAEYSAENAAG